MSKWLSQAELVEQWGKSRQTVAEWAQRPGAPKRQRNGRTEYQWPEWNEWWANERERTAREAAEPADLEEAKARKMAAEARLAELELERQEGRLVTVDDATKAVEAMLEQLRSQLQTLPQRWAPGVLGCKSLAEVTAKLDQAVTEAMTSLSEGA